MSMIAIKKVSIYFLYKVVSLLANLTTRATYINMTEDERKLAKKEYCKIWQRNYRRKSPEKFKAFNESRKAANSEKTRLRNKLRYDAEKLNPVCIAKRRASRRLHKRIQKKPKNKRQLTEVELIARAEFRRSYQRTEKGKSIQRNGALRRRAIKLGCQCSATATEVMDIKNRASLCCYCGAEFSKVRAKTIDHVIPLSGGGTHELSNLVVCCHNCNSKKGARPIEIFLSVIGNRPRSIGAEQGLSI